MKFQILIELVFLLLSKRSITVKEIMNRFEISRSTVFRYIDELTLASVPIAVRHGRNGGFYIPDDYKLSYGFFTDAEIRLLKQALENISSFENRKDLDYDMEKTKRSLQEKLSAFVKD